MYSFSDQKNLCNWVKSTHWCLCDYSPTLRKPTVEIHPFSRTIRLGESPLEIGDFFGWCYQENCHWKIIYMNSSLKGITTPRNRRKKCSCYVLCLSCWSWRLYIVSSIAASTTYCFSYLECAYEANSVPHQQISSKEALLVHWWWVWEECMC